MPIDPLSLAIGAVVALIPLLAGLWSLQRRLTREQGEQALLQERLEHAQLSQAGLLAQLDACRAELAEVSEIKVEQQTELAGLRRENELLQQERQIAREAAQSWHQQRERNEAELRRLTAECAALAAELQENRDNQQQRLDDLQGARNELRAQFPNWHRRSSTNASSVSPKPASSALASCSTRSRSVSRRSRSVSTRAINRKRASVFP